MSTNYRAAAGELTRLLGLATPPLSIAFASERSPGVALLGEPMPAPASDGRTGRAPAGCVFWVKGLERSFATAPEDHGNCSVGSLTHGLLSLETAAQRADVAELVGAKWVSPEVFTEIPVVKARPAYILYGPLEDGAFEPDVVFLRLNGKQLMVLHDAWPALRVEGKPQCHIIAIAKERGEIAVSVGCMLSRVRTGMSNHDVTCAIPGGCLGALIDRMRAAREADDRVAAYASEDSRRFG